MNPLTHTHTQLLQRAFEKLLGAGRLKDMAYCTCLPADASNVLGADASFAPAGWRVFVVTNDAHAGERRITSGQAVELREEGGAPTLLLVDAQTAGAGMNGIYSASREVREADLFKKAQEEALEHIANNGLSRSIVQAASRAGARLSRRAVAVGWDGFDFHAHVAHDVDSFGRHIARLCLWPIDKPAQQISELDIEASAGLTRRLFGDTEQQRTARGRVDSLFLKDDDLEIARRIEQVIERGRRQPIAEVMQTVAEEPDLWLGRIEPEFFKQEVQKIELVSWMPKGKLAKWSGLTLSEGKEMPEGEKEWEFLLPTRDDLPAKERPRLEVRFLVTPELQAGAAEYRVIVRAGDKQLATRTVAHQKKKEQAVRLTDEDFDDVDIDSSYEAEVVVELVGGENAVESEPSILFRVKRGDAPAKVTSENARFVRSLVQGAITTADDETFVKDCQDGASYMIDEKGGYIIFRPSASRTSYKLARPSMIASIERQLSERAELGRWRIRVRADGQPIGEPEFVPVGDEGPDARKLRDAHEAWCEETTARGGSWGRIYAGQTSNKAERYVNAWCEAVEAGMSEYTLLHTIEVRTQSDRFVGMIVLPGHPMRVAWHAGYDEIARHWRYVEAATDKQVSGALDALDGSYFPAMLPGPESVQSLVFADVIGFYAVAMLDVAEREPNAQIALLKAALGVSESELISAVGGETSRMVADEVRSYAKVHAVAAPGGSGLLRVNALRPGDGAVIARALGEVIREENKDDEAEDTEGKESLLRLRFQLDLYPADVDSDVTGRFLTRISEAHRSGASGIDTADRWMLERRIPAATQTLPGLSWARRMRSDPDSAAHLSVVFDLFETTIECVDETTSDVIAPLHVAPLHVYGLSADARREYVTQPEVLWRTWVPKDADGLKHPAGRGFSERLVKAQSAALHAVAMHRGQSGRWPVLTTRLTIPTRHLLDDVHALSDWVVTVDRNAGIEYFDSPAEGADVFDSYVIDCVPDRGGLGNLRMVTSTTRLDEVEAVLERVLDDMQIRYERSDVQRFLRALKSLSGRMAMRLASLSANGEELLALAMLYEHLQKSGDISLGHGFLVPLDDVPGLITNRDEAEGVSADLVFVGLGKRSGLTFTFLTVRHRRSLRYAADSDMLDQVNAHLGELQQSWMKEFFPQDGKDAGVSVNRARLVRVLRFYADKALRHALGAISRERITDEEREPRRQAHIERHQRFIDEIDKLVEKLGAERVAVADVSPRLYVFCPEMQTDRALADWGGLRYQVFGASSINAAEKVPNNKMAVEPLIEPSAESVGTATQETIAAFESVLVHDAPSETAPSATLLARAPTSTAHILLGRRGDDDVKWTVSSKANPHLMMVGLSGMGKTEALLNIMRQMTAQGIVPIVLSYHPDIDQRMSDALEGVQLLTMNTLGYNPMVVADDGSHAHVDNAGLLRDSFAAIWPDLGEVQLNELRSAMKRSYEDLGWGQANGVVKELPQFRAFYERLRREKNPDRSLKTLIGRLEELDDYGIFRSTGDARSLLSATQPTVLSLHESGNENVQRALTMLALHGMYTDMFRRGVQPGLTHAIIVDEAHRASRLKWLARFAKEGRKFGISLMLASQSAADFQSDLFSGIASYLLLRMTEQDAAHLTKAIASSDRARAYADRLKRLDKYEALFFTEGQAAPDHVRLESFKK
ncbi:MAG: hypothetical protein NTZ50_02485 [Chloroflexi bacterium]|nr:hypothetical protein [Chloroflexota bacterium]